MPTFDEMTKRLKREMTRHQLSLLARRDTDEPMCVLCLVGTPRPPGTSVYATAYHHIKPRGAGGGEPNDLWNLAPTCAYHHTDWIASFKELWQLAMVETGKASPRDYGMTQNKHPLIRTCREEFGFGTHYYADGIPEVVQKLFTGVVDKRLTNFCQDLCPVADHCLLETREKWMRIIKEEHGTRSTQ